MNGVLASYGFDYEKIRLILHLFFTHLGCLYLNQEQINQTMVAFAFNLFCST